MSGPWMKFYPSDWRADPKLRMCSIGARGLWVEMLCVMHEAEPYGYLLSNGNVVTSRQMAALAGISAGECMKFMLELASAGVYSIDDSKRIFSRRMVRDKEKAERDRLNGKGGGNPKLKGAVNEGVNPQVKAQKPEARSQSKEGYRSIEGDQPAAVQIDLEELIEGKAAQAPSRFEEFWQAFPRRDGANPRKPAETKFNSLVKGGVDPEMMIAAIRCLAQSEGAKGNVGTRFIPRASTWLSEQRWTDHAAVAALAELSDVMTIEQAVAMFAKMRVWSRHAHSPAPGEPGCKASAELLAKYGLDLMGRKIEVEPA